MKIRGLMTVVAWLGMLMFVELTQASIYSGGSGTAEDPYQIATAQDLIDLGQEPNDYDKHFILTADIDLDPNLPGGRVFDRAVIAYNTEGSYDFQGTPFTGSFNGDGHTIRNLHISGDNCVGLFGQIGMWRAGKAGFVFHLGLEDVSINGRWREAGSLAARNFGGIIVSCYSTGKINGRSLVGGLVGHIQKGVIQFSYSDVSVSGENCCGGLVGLSTRGNILSCHSTGSVSGKQNIGGLVGNNGLSNIVTCYSVGGVTGENDVGGLVGCGGSGYYISNLWDINTSGCPQSRVGNGVSSPKTQNVRAYLDAGWDFVHERANGTNDEWVLSDRTWPTLSVFSGIVPIEPKGKGTKDDPYLIADANDIGAIWFRPWSCYRLVADIDLSGIKWSRAVIPWFGGTFDGNGFSIHALKIKGADGLGLFGSLGPDAIVSELTLETVEVNGRGICIGTFAGENSGTITKCSCTGSVEGDHYIGGLAGLNYGILKSNSSTVKVKGEEEVGGLAGRNNGQIISSSNEESINGNEMVGGVAGSNEGLIILSFNTGTIGGKHEIGGLTGGNWSYVSTSYSNGIVHGDRNLGGLIGSNGGVVISCYSAGSVKGELLIGGLSGTNIGNITSSYSCASVHGRIRVGGLVGENATGSVSSCFSVGEVNGATSFNREQVTGGLIGYSEDGYVTSSFWNTETSNQSQSAGGVGLGTVEMQDLDTFVNAGWDLSGRTIDGTCEVWHCQNGSYPNLAVFSGSIPTELEGAGTLVNPYLISSPIELGSVWFRPNAHYRLTSDIELSGIHWKQSVIPWFSGHFEGNHFFISSLQIDGAGYLGLFGQVINESKISNLALTSVDVNGLGKFVGGLTGKNQGGVTSCWCTGRVQGAKEVGGLVGHNSADRYRDWDLVGKDKSLCGTLTRCHCDVTVRGDNFVGGLVGGNQNQITSCYSHGSVSGEMFIGGLVGYNKGPGHPLVGEIHAAAPIRFSYSTGAVSGKQFVGGLVGGGGQGGIIESSFWDSETSGQDERTGNIGVSTAQMQDINTFLNAGWDFVDETENGTDDIWFMPENDYPQLVQ